MARKDYINAAAAAVVAAQTRIRNEPIPADVDPQLHIIKRDAQLRGVRRTAAHLADFFADDNPTGFDVQLFLTNCGYGA